MTRTAQFRRQATARVTQQMSYRLERENVARRKMSYRHGIEFDPAIRPRRNSRRKMRETIVTQCPAAPPVETLDIGEELDKILDTLHAANIGMLVIDYMEQLFTSPRFGMPNLARLKMLFFMFRMEQLERVEHALEQMGALSFQAEQEARYA